MGSQLLKSSKNGDTVLTLWYEPLRGETGLTASTPWLKFGEIGVCRGEPPCDPNQSSAPSVIDYNRLTPGEAKKRTHCYQENAPIVIKGGGGVVIKGGGGGHPKFG